MNQVYLDQVKVRIYLEGVLFPYAKSVSISQTARRSTASISVPPSIKLRVDEWAGMKCHIFYATKRVYERFGEDDYDVTDSGWDTLDPEDVTIRGWPVLFQGELSGTSFNRTVRSEDVVLEFVNHSRHFEQTILYYYDPGKEHKLDYFRQAYYFGNTRVDVDADGLLSNENRILFAMRDRMKDLDNDEAQSVAYASVMNEVLKTAGRNNSNFARFDNQLKLTQRFGAYADPDIPKLLSLQQLSALVSNRAEALPSYVSLMKVMELATGLTHYDWVHIAQPSLRDENLTILSSNNYGEDLVTQEEIDSIKKSASVLAKAKLSKLLENNGIRLDVGDIYISEEILSNAKRISAEKFSDLVYQKYLASFRTGDGTLQKSFEKVIDEGFLPTSRKSNVFDSKKEQDSAEFTDELAEKNINKDSDQTKNIDESQDFGTLSAIEQRTLALQDIITEYAVTPNMQFAQPPKCNVILPGSMTSYGMSISHFQEITRMFGRVNFIPGNNPSNDAIVEWYYAPISQSLVYVGEDNVSEWTAGYEDFLNKYKTELKDGTEET